MNAYARPSALVGEGGLRSGPDEGSRRASQPPNAPAATAAFADRVIHPSSVGHPPDTFSRKGGRSAL